MSSFCSFATTIKHIDECDRSHILFISLFLISYIRLLTEIRVKYLSKKVSPFNWTRNVFGEDPLYLLIYFRFSYLVCLWLILKWIWPEFDNFWLKIQLSVLNEIIIYWIILIHKIPILCTFLRSIDSHRRTLVLHKLPMLNQSNIQQCSQTLNIFTRHARKLQSIYFFYIHTGSILLPL